MWVGLTQSVEGPTRTKDCPLPEQEGILQKMIFGLELGHWLFLESSA